MSDAPVTIIVSDLHVGGGPDDAGDDHVYDSNQFVRFLQTVGSEHAGRTGPVELIINGDFLEFAQVAPHAYALGSASYWCSQAESLQKLEVILKGHADIFEAIARFQGLGHRVTIAAGNHDVDLYWPAVQDRLCAKAGPVEFEVGHETYSRYDGALVIGHGHMYDPANRFSHWDNPILAEPSGDDRLEMCPGTIFMVKFVNWLETQYPFSDNIKPVTALGRLLWRENKLGLLSVAWTISKFAARHPLSTTMRTSETPPDVGRVLRQNFSLRPAFKKAVIDLYRKAVDSEGSDEKIAGALATEQGMVDFLAAMIENIPPDTWLPVFDRDLPQTLSLGDERSRTLAIIPSALKNEKLTLQNAARKLFLTGAKVVVFGHTHQPDRLEEKGKQYFNPGSWTRYVEMDDMAGLSLADLKNEADFPYALNFVRVEKTSTGNVAAQLHCFARMDGMKFKSSGMA
jgi:UDP-2,3-diacylglucosamine pyrophosphatase LpxH